MINFSENSLKLMPTNALTGLSNSLSIQAASKLSSMQAVDAKMAKLQGIATLPTPSAGRVLIDNGGEPLAQTIADGTSVAGQAFSNGAAALNSSFTNPEGVDVFVPGTTDFTPTAEDISQMVGTLNNYYQAFDLGGTSQELAATLATLGQQRDALQNEVDQINATQQQIQDVVQKRASGELPEPVLNLSALDTGELGRGAQTIIQNVIEENKKFVDDNIITPFNTNQLLIASLKAQTSGIGDVEPIFDLEYGPPISAGNKFILSQDGLYYDSRNAEVPVITPDPVSATGWTLDFASNKGGRGLTFSEPDGYEQAGTIFDLEADLGENNPRVLDFYKYDDVLQQFEDDRMSQMSEVSGYIAQIKSEGYSESDAVVQSYYGQLAGVASTYASKIRKRKRQLEIAAIYGRDVFFVTDRTHPLGEGIFLQYFPPVGKSFEFKLQYKDLPDHLKSLSIVSLEGGETFAWNKDENTIVDRPLPDNILAIQGQWKEIPRIPINDFSYLSSDDVPLNIQRKLTLFSEDLDTVVAPFEARYVVAPQSTPDNFTDSLAVDMIGFGDWVHRESSGNFSSTVPLYKSLTDDIVSEDLLVCYNFLDPEAVTQPSSNVYALNNAAEGSTRMDGKLVSYNRSFVFPSGVGTAYMGGTIFNEEAKFDSSWDTVYGSYVRLPNITKDYVEFETPNNGTRELDNLFYAGNGVSFDFWSYIPNWGAGYFNKFHRYRLVLSNENSGPLATDYITASPLRQTADGTTTNVGRTLGLMIGWRDAGDPRGAATNKFTSPSGTEFIISPTVSQNQSYTEDPTKSWGHSIAIAEKWSEDTKAPASGVTEQLGMYISSGTRTADGSGIMDVSGSFMHFNVSFDYEANEVRVCIDGSLLSTSSITDVLGVNPGHVKTPTPVSMDLSRQTDKIAFNNPSKESFLGNNELYDEYVTPERVAFPVFTPWIIGGGYSDNMPSIPGTSYRPMGFMGSNTNNTYQGTVKGDAVVSQSLGTPGTFILGQHLPPLSNSSGGSAADRFQIPRSGLDGYVGSFKIYAKPLSTTEAKENYEAQKGFFKNVLL